MKTQKSKAVMAFGGFGFRADSFVRVLGMLGWRLCLGIPSLQSLMH